MSAQKNKQAYQIQGTYHSKIFRQTCILNCFHRRNHTGHALLPTLCHCHSPPPTCVLRKWVSLSVKYKVRESKQRLGCLIVGAKRRRAFLLEPTRYFWAKKQCYFASQTFQIITSAIAINGCSPALLNFYVYYCKVNLCVDDQPWRYVFNWYILLIRSPVEVLYVVLAWSSGLL